MTRLSVNINKIATLRNARGGNNPDVIKAAVDCERFGAHGITVHPRPDERHIRYSDVVTVSKWAAAVIIGVGALDLMGYTTRKQLEGQIIRLTGIHQRS